MLLQVHPQKYQNIIKLFSIIFLFISLALLSSQKTNQSDLDFDPIRKMSNRGSFLMKPLFFPQIVAVTSFYNDFCILTFNFFFSNVAFTYEILKEVGFVSKISSKSTSSNKKFFFFFFYFLEQSISRFKYKI